MKKTTKILLMITFFLLLLAGCAEKINFEAQLAGKWYSEVKYLESTEQGH